MTAILRRALPALALVAMTGCGAAGGLGEILGGVLNAPAAGGGTQQISAEVVTVDTRNSLIQVRTSDGQTGNISYDQNTRVIYQQQEHPVTALERGDMVTMQVQQVNNNQLYTQQINVTQSVQDRNGTGNTSTGSTEGLQRLEGTIGLIDRNRGVFELRSGGANIVVSLAYNATSSVRDRYSRIRNGDVVRIEGRWIGNGQVQIERFLN